MEELWLEEGRAPIFQGLLQIAVGLYHHRNGNISGSIKLFTQGIDKLHLLPELSLGIHLGQLVADSKTYVAKLMRLESEPFAFYDLNIEVLDPRLQELLDAMKLQPPTPHDEE
jgi:hypothetical protein